MDKKKIITIVIVLATILLAGVAVFTAIRLYQLRQESVAPTAPTSKPAAATEDIEKCVATTFTIPGGPTATPTGGPTATPTGSPTATPTSAPTDGLTATPTGTATATPVGGTVTPTTTPTDAPELPDAGISYPTIAGAIVGILVILGSLLLVF